MILRRQVYIAGGLTHASAEDTELYERIARVCEDEGFRPYVPHRDTGSRNDVLNEREVFATNLAALQNSVLMIVELSVPSFGVGMECEYALARGIPVIAFARDEVNVSRMMLGHPAVSMIYRHGKQPVDVVLSGALRAIKLSRNEAFERGLLIAFEGSGGRGADAISKMCAEVFRKKYPGREVIWLADAFETALWSNIKKTANSLSPIADVLLQLTSIVDQWQRIIVPAIRRGALIFSERFHDSWLVEHAEHLARELPSMDSTQRLYFLNVLSSIAQGIRAIRLPDHAFLLTADLEDTLVLQTRGGTSVPAHDDADFSLGVHKRYMEFFQKNSERMTLINTTRRSADDVLGLVVKFLEREFGL